MTANEDGTYTISFKNVEFETAGTIWYKVCKNHAWDESYGMDKKDGNAEYIVNEPCTVGEIVFTFNPAAEGFKVSCEFKDIVTGINSIAANGQTVVVYNLKGQRVMNAQKGLYIQNGKKVVIK